ncbi:hypothetical protein MANES_16G093733v8 [Manihot esculenta]|uniref:Uncharacterized protein n=1 Tax=Manihot esculenta TaxID=3983 RepID=A0ACB7G890_MANES|nr:hypothetical protein MANES_16G093733v8 [Manihot esculenta]
MEEINNLKGRLLLKFEMKDLDAAKQILGMRIFREWSAGILNLVDGFNPRSMPLANHLKLSKKQSPKTSMERDHMAKVPYASAIGSLMYAMVCTRPDISHAVGAVSIYMSDLRKEYLKGTTSISLCYGNGKVILEGLVYADLSRNVDISKSTFGYVYIINETVAEYIAINEVELDKKKLEKVLFTDSQSVIHLVKNPLYHFRAKHIRRRYHFTCSLIEEGEMCLKKIKGTKNPIDILTKSVDAGKLGLCKASVGLLQ